ncbi:hypothetical protein BCO18442_01828 [Burkholderia contaminans]|nr:hypothetical protein BCO18442_01828 [Burkholderia contaminans]
MRGVGAIVRRQVERILRAFGDHAVRAARERVLDREARIGEAVGVALMEPAHAAECMKGRDERDAELPLHAQCRVARHEEIRVHHVDRVGFASHARDHAVRKRDHVRQQPLLGHVGRWSGRYVDHAHARADRHDFRQVRIVAARIDVDVEAALGQLLRDVRDIDVLPAGIDAADHPQRRCMLTDQRDSLHGVAPGIGAAWMGHRCLWLGKRHTRCVARGTPRRDTEKITTGWMKGRLIGRTRDGAAPAARHATCAVPFTCRQSRLDERRSR